MHEYQRVVFKSAAKVTDGYSSSHKAKDYVKRDDDPLDVFAVDAGTVRMSPAARRRAQRTQTW